MYSSYSNYFGNSSFFLKMIPFLILFDIILRGLSLWYSARKGQKIWFIALLIVNSLGILPIIYLILNRTKKTTKSTKKAIPEKTETKPSKKKTGKTKAK